MISLSAPVHSIINVLHTEVIITFYREADVFVEEGKLNRTLGLCMQCGLTALARLQRLLSCVVCAEMKIKYPLSK